MQYPAKKQLKWLLLANGTSSKILVCRDNQLLTDHTITIYDSETRLLSRELGTDRPGRGSNRVGSGKHVMDSKTDLHEKVKLEFAEQIAKIINSKAIDNEFDQLVVIAPPEFLGEIRGLLKKQATDKIINEINKDLTHLTDKEIMAITDVKYIAA